jgi:phosphatidylethanolamine-binding protein (PEBP) family uncharacterized protein
MELTTYLSILLTLIPTISGRYLRQPTPSYSQQVIPVPPIAPINTVRDSLLASSIIPEVLDDFDPTYSLDIIYPASHTTVQLGNDIPVSFVQDSPVFEIHGVKAQEGVAPLEQENSKKKNATYTLILTDPDAKSRKNPKWSEMCHWIVTNITVADTPSEGVLRLSNQFHTMAELLAVDELVSYLPPGPPPKTGRHRYVFVLLKGEEGGKLKEPSERRHWGYGKKRHGVRDWAEEMGLEVVGANWFYAMNKKQ